LDRLSESVQKIIRTFEKACGVPCISIKPADEDGLLQRGYNPFCAVCAKEQLKRFGGLRCGGIHKYASYQADKWGGKYEYLCPAGAAFIASAVQKTDDIAFGVIAGPFLMVDVREFLGDDLDRFFKGLCPRSVSAAAKTLLYIESARVSSLADMLFILSAYAGERDSIDIRIMQQTAKNQNELFYSLYGIKQAENLNYKYPIEAEKLLQHYISKGDKAASQTVLNDILGHIFFCSGGNFEMIKARVTELIVLLSRAAIEGGAGISEVFGINYDYLNDIHNFKTLDELNHWLAKALIRFTNTVFDVSESKHSEIIKKVMDYIRSNYMKKLTLNDISNYVNFSVSYLSRIFKEETGENLSAFINRIRVENSKMLLLNNEIPLIEVSYLCGFDDQSYYSKVFKKITGVTPGRFREKRGNI
jgi:two-component system response regulator YesN